MTSNSSCFAAWKKIICKSNAALPSSDWIDIGSLFQAEYVRTSREKNCKLDRCSKTTRALDQSLDDGRPAVRSMIFSSTITATGGYVVSNDALEAGSRWRLTRRGHEGRRPTASDGPAVEDHVGVTSSPSWVGLLSISSSRRSVQQLRLSQWSRYSVDAADDTSQPHRILGSFLHQKSINRRFSSAL